MRKTLGSQGGIKHFVEYQSEGLVVAPMFADVDFDALKARFASEATDVFDYKLEPVDSPAFLDPYAYGAIFSSHPLFDRFGFALGADDPERAGEEFPFSALW
jgi:hypothetical protein